MSNPLMDPESELPTVGQELEQTVAQVLQQAEHHQRFGQLQEAADLYRAILEVQPNHAGANHNLGILAVLSQQPGVALPLLRTALETNLECEDYWLSYIEGLIQADQIEAAVQTLGLGRQHGLQGATVEALAKRLLANPQLTPPAEAQSSAAMQQKDVSASKRSSPGIESAPSRREIEKLTGLRRKGRAADIEAFARELTARFPEHGLGWKTLGVVLNQQHRLDQALFAMAKAAALLPDDPEVQNNLGVMLQHKARFAEAEGCFGRALELKPDFAGALCNLGNLLRIQGRLGESEGAFLRAIKLGKNAVIYNNLGTTLLEQGRILDAESSFRQAIKVDAGFALAHTNLGVSLRVQGRLEEAISSQRQALKHDPGCTEKHSNLLFTLNYTSSSPEHSHLELARRYGRLVQKKAGQPINKWNCSAQPERLRVGLVSGDLYNHPVGFFLESLLHEFHSERVELIAYPTNPKNDHLTARIKPQFTAWKPLFGLSDEAAARLIQADGIHVLLDLSGHTSHNRLPMFAWKPAPVQASWLGYFATTGVEAIDYFLADEMGVPESQRQNFSEALWYLPDTRLCFSEPESDLPVASTPALEKGHITFGCFQKLTKVGDEVLQAWSAILAALPAARLRWQCGQFGDPAVVAQLFKRLQQVGIDPARVSLQGSMPRANYLAAHAEVDLILDSFPFPGGTTTCEALWMGVPTVTLAGNTLLSRQGASLLSAAGLNDWVANNLEEYVAKAIALASDLPALAALRAGLRQQILASPLFDAECFVRNFEAALWGMWQTKRPADHLLAPGGLKIRNALPT